MIGAKDIARKIASGCDHSIAVRVPCAHCVEVHMAAWAAALRADFKNELRDEWAALELERDKSRKAAEALQKQNENLSSNLRRFRDENESLREKLKKASALLSEARIQLHAEQASKQFVKVAEA